ncbi:hypothetical protein Tco_0364765 [Tanacetum coccineum]
MNGQSQLLCNFVEEFLGTVRLGNDQFAPNSVLWRSDSRACLGTCRQTIWQDDYKAKCGYGKEQKDEDQTVIRNKANDLLLKLTQVFSNLSDGRDEKAFLNGPLKEEVYVAQPEGIFVDCSCRLPCTAERLLEGYKFLGDKLVSWMSKKKMALQCRQQRQSSWRYLQVVLKLSVDEDTIQDYVQLQQNTRCYCDLSQP